NAARRRHPAAASDAAARGQSAAAERRSARPRLWLHPGATRPRATVRGRPPLPPRPLPAAPGDLPAAAPITDTPAGARPAAEPGRVPSPPWPRGREAGPGPVADRPSDAEQERPILGDLDRHPPRVVLRRR